MGSNVEVLAEIGALTKEIREVDLAKFSPQYRRETTIVLGQPAEYLG